MKTLIVIIVALIGFAFYQAVKAEPVQDNAFSLRNHVLYNDGTEQPWSSVLNEESRPGWYVDVITEERLFRSEHKYDSGTGWPSFWEVSGDITLEQEFLPWRGTEVRSADGKRHYGHVFNDGPRPTNLRYCMNGVALKFIPDEDS